MLIKNARGTIRNIEPTQLNEYKRKGYEEIIVEEKTVLKASTKSNVSKESK